MAATNLQESNAYLLKKSIDIQRMRSKRNIIITFFALNYSNVIIYCSISYRFVCKYHINVSSTHTRMTARYRKITSNNSSLLSIDDNNCLKSQRSYLRNA